MMSDDDYKSYVIDTLTRNNVSQEEAEILANKELEKWKTIGEDAIPIHTILSQFDFRRSRDDFKDALKDTKLSTQAIYQLYDTLKRFKRKNLGEISARAGGVPSLIINNLNLKAEIENLDKT